MAIDLTGVYHCDDNGYYYVRQLGDTVVWAGLHDSGFHQGIEFANVFRGTLGADRLSAVGEWVDVPRGGAQSSGKLRFTITQDNSFGGVFPGLILDPTKTSGGFGGNRWTYTGPTRLGYHDIEGVANQVRRIDSSLAENNPPCRDFTVMWGYTAELKNLAENPNDTDHIRPGIQGPNPLPPDPHDYCSFINHAPGDADITFNLLPDWNLTDPENQFWATGWVPTPLNSKTRSQFIQDLIHQWGFFHCENMMYGRTNSGDQCKATPDIRLPGWNETSGNSILINGRPVGSVTPSDAGDDEHDFITFEIGPNGRSVALSIPQKVRVTGVVAWDTGHGSGQPAEIHPVYQIDIITDDFIAATSQTLSGAWHGSPDEGPTTYASSATTSGGLASPGTRAAPSRTSSEERTTTAQVSSRANGSTSRWEPAECSAGAHSA
jgi:hypothetical protein